MAEQEGKTMTDIRNIPVLWCDDITFCQEEFRCEAANEARETSGAKLYSTRFSVESPTDCPKGDKE